MTPTELLKELIAIPSVNPMGRDVCGPEFLEAGMTDYLERWFTDLGADHQRIELMPRRSNIVARYQGNPDRPTVMMDAHQDTVPVDGMTIPAFDPEERDGRIYGRGSCDVKGGMASMLTAFARVVRERPAGAGNIIMSCTCDEEQGMTGVRDLAARWTETGNAPDDWLTHTPDSIIIAEPTSLNIVVAHRGVTRWKLRTTGKAAHSSKPSEGVNAIYRMAEVVRRLEEYAAQLERESTPHVLCGSPTLSVGRINGGISVNVVPDECTIEIDRRVIPGEDQSTVIKQVDTWLRKYLGFEYEMLPPWCMAGSLSDDKNGPLAERLLTHVEAVSGRHQKIGVAYGTNAAVTGPTGVPTVVFGPGSIDQAHTKDEWIEAAQLDLAAEILFRFLSTNDY
ncbi:MAG: M20 family metallopeptidase [Fuerstiella sp.]|nr:M20 family metallopeptidase [Fuerstiella sp.]